MYVADASMVTAVGGDAKLTSASINAGVSRVQESNFSNKDFNPIKMATVPNDVLPPLAPAVQETFPTLTALQKRMLRLCDAGLSGSIRKRLAGGPICLLLAGPEESLPGVANGMGASFLKALSQQLGLVFDVSSSRKFGLGRAGVLYAIDHALKYMEATGASLVLVGGVETYWDLSLLGQFDAEDRLLASGVPDGFAPGEAAGFLLLSRDQVQPAEGLRTVRLSRPGLAQEPGHLYSEEPCLGDGLSQAFQEAIANGHSRPLQAIFSSMNGERYWAKELGVAMTRSSTALESDVSIKHPADCFGDIGAAFPAVTLGLLAHANTGSYLVYGSSDGPSRAAICAEVL